MAERTASRHVSIREVHAVSDPALRAAHMLLRRTFHSAEVLSLRDWAQVLEERREGLWSDLNWHLMVATRHGRLVGAASGSYLGNLNVGVVGYIAVIPAERGRGAGSRLRNALRRALEADAWRIRRRHLSAIMGEVRADNPWLRRVVRHHGAIALDFPYYQPAMRWLRSHVQFVLYYQPIATPRHSLPAADVRQLVYTLWRRVYRVPRPLSSKPFRKMLAALKGRERVGQKRIGE
jgi:GNAT superfamily N-acetyltransferase